MGSPLTVTGVLAVVLIFISSVFFLLILSPVPADMVSRQVVLSCICQWLCDRSARSSAELRSSSCVQGVHCIQLFLPVVVVFMIQSMTRRKRNGDSRHPWRTPVLTSKLSDVSDLAAHVLVGTADEGDDLLRESVVPQQLPQRLSVHTVEGLPIVYEVDVEGGVPLQRLLHYNA